MNINFVEQSRKKCVDFNVNVFLIILYNLYLLIKHTGKYHVITINNVKIHV